MCFVSGHVHLIKKRGRFSYSSCFIDEETEEKTLNHLPSSLEVEPWFMWHQQGYLLPLFFSASHDFHYRLEVLFKSCLPETASLDLSGPCPENLKQAVDRSPGGLSCRGELSMMGPKDWDSSLHRHLSEFYLKSLTSWTQLPYL